MAATLPSTLPFKKGTLTWRVAREPIVGLAATPTLLLQVAHPLVAAGVRTYSDFEQNPWGRLWRTLDITLKLAFAEPKVSKRQETTLRAIHARVQGTSSEGVPYRALDPELLLWVWATLVHGALDTYERMFGRLSDADRDRYCEEQKLIAHAAGVPEGRCPSGYTEFRAYLDRMIGTELRATDVARSVIAVGIRPPVIWPIRPLAGRMNRLSIGLLPAGLRDELLAANGLEWSPADERALGRLLALSRLMVRLVPRPLRELPTRYLVARRKPMRLFQRRASRYTTKQDRLAS